MGQVEVLGLELRQFRHETTRALVPRVVGQLSSSPRARSTATRTDRDTFLASWDALPATRSLFTTLLNYADKEGLLVNWGRKGFSIRAESATKWVTLAQGFPPDCFGGPIYVFSQLGLTEGASIFQKGCSEALAHVPSMTHQKSGWRIAPQQITSKDMETLLLVLGQMADAVRRSGGNTSE